MASLTTSARPPITFSLKKDISPFGKTNSDGITFDRQVNVSGLDLSESWQYRTSLTGSWLTGAGSSFILGEAVYAAGSIQVRKILANNLPYTVVTNSSQIRVDITPPAAVTLALAQDTGIAGDLITKNVVVNVSGLEAGATWEYNLSGRWLRGSGTSFNLPDRTYAAGVIKVRQYDVAGNVQDTLSSTATITVDTRTPTPTLTTGSGANTGNATVQSTEVGTAYLVKSTITVTDLASITGSGDTNYNSVSIATANSNTSLSLAGLVDGSYKLYVVDAAGNLSAASGTTYSVDSSAPTVTSVAISSATGIQNSTLKAGDVVSVTVTMSEATTVTGTPTLALNIGTTPVNATYVSGSGTTALVFSYTILAGQTDANGISVDLNSLTLNGGTITDPTGNSAVPMHSAVTENAGYLVDTTAPATPSTAPQSFVDNQGSIQSTTSTAVTTDDDTPGVNIGNLPAGSTGANLYVNGVKVAATYDAATGTLTPDVALATGQLYTLPTP